MKRTHTTKGTTAVTARPAAPSTVNEWLEQHLADPERRRAVDTLLEEMRLEDDLVALREARKLSQRELAERAGVKQPMIARIESGQVRNIELRTLLRLVSAMNGTVRIVIGRDAKTGKFVPKRRAARRAAAV